MNNDKQNKKYWTATKILPLIGVPLAILGLVGAVLHVYQKVVSGAGLRTYFTGHGTEMNYISVLIIVILIPVVLISGWAINKIIERREMQDFHSKKKIHK